MNWIKISILKSITGPFDANNKSARAPLLNSTIVQESGQDLESTEDLRGENSSRQRN